MNLTSLETDILSWIAERNPLLGPALAGSRVIRRERAAAFYTYLTEDDGDWEHPPVHGPEITSRKLDNGGGSILWLTGGRPACLEVYTNGENFTEELDEYELK